VAPWRRDPPEQDDTDTLADENCSRRDCLFWAAGFGLAQVVDDVLALDALHRRRSGLPFHGGRTPEDRVSLSLADLLEDDLLGQLGSDAASGVVSR